MCDKQIALRQLVSIAYYHKTATYCSADCPEKLQYIRKLWLC
jgi:hypothetical protein